MLVNPKKFHISPYFKHEPIKYGNGMYGAVCFDEMLWNRQIYEKSYDLDLPFNEYGLVDSVDQFYEKFGKILEDDPRPFVVGFYDLQKDSGFRWHKEGPYYGNGTPTREYIGEEEGFEDGVWGFHVYLVDNIELE